MSPIEPRGRGGHNPLLRIDAVRAPAEGMDKLIITVAPTGSVPRKKDTPHVPVTPDEIAETAYRCEQEGAPRQEHNAGARSLRCGFRPARKAVDRLGPREGAGALPAGEGSRRRRPRPPRNPAAHAQPTPADRNVRRRGDVPDATADDHD